MIWSERNQQVKLMSKIYRSSKRLLIWLGVEGQESDLAMDFISSLERKTSKDENNSTLTEESLEELVRAWLLEEVISPTPKLSNRSHTY
jgi:hypothetical protein